MITQLRTLWQLQRQELERLAGDLDPEAAERLRRYVALHAQEAELVLDELADLRRELDG